MSSKQARDLALESLKSPLLIENAVAASARNMMNKACGGSFGIKENANAIAAACAYLASVKADKDVDCSNFQRHSTIDKKPFLRLLRDLRQILGIDEPADATPRKGTASAAGTPKSARQTPTASAKKTPSASVRKTITMSASKAFLMQPGSSKKVSEDVDQVAAASEVPTSRRSTRTATVNSPFNTPSKRKARDEEEEEEEIVTPSKSTRRSIARSNVQMSPTKSNLSPSKSARGKADKSDAEQEAETDAEVTKSAKKIKKALLNPFNNLGKTDFEMLPEGRKRKRYVNYGDWSYLENTPWLKQEREEVWTQHNSRLLKYIKQMDLQKTLACAREYYRDMDMEEELFMDLITIPLKQRPPANGVH